jgi:hypothetical protein
MRRHEFGSVKCAAMAWICGAAVLLGSGGARAGGIIGSGTLYSTMGNPTGSPQLYNYFLATPINVPGSVSGAASDAGSGSFGGIEFSASASISWQVDLTSNALSFDFSSTATELGEGNYASVQVNSLNFTSPTRSYAVSITSNVTSNVTADASQGGAQATALIELYDSSGLIGTYFYGSPDGHFNDTDTFGSRVRLQQSQTYSLLVDADAQGYGNPDAPSQSATSSSSLSFRLSAVAPEPSTGVLALIGGLVLAGGAWRSRRGAAAA